MPKIRSHLRHLLEPLLGAVFFAAWVARSSSQIIGDVPLRSETFITNPYAVLIALGFALAIALCRVRPGAALSLTGGLLVVQLLFWPTRFSQTSWVAYLALVLLVIGISAYGKAVMRRALLGLSILGSVVVSALLNFPFLSLSGVFGTINGKEGASIEVVQGFLSWTAVGILLTVGAWHVGSRTRSRTTKPGTESSGEILADTAREETRTAVIDSRPQSPGLADMNSIGALSLREREIFLLAARGLSNSDIAQSAHIGESTVKTHLSSILTKLGFTSRSQIVAHAYRNGLLRSSPALDGSASS